jgi:hypothetical protein
MLPRTVSCEECGKTAVVRGYGRVEYDWQPEAGSVATIPNIKLIRLTIDCPSCGVIVQEHFPAQSSRK